MSKPRIAVIGLGMASKPHLEALAGLSAEIEVAGIYNRSRSKAEAIAASSGYSIYERPEDIAADPVVDIVLLITPPDNRLQIIEMMAKAGKHILCEKPIERSLEASTRIVDICEQAGVRLGIVFQNRFRPAALRLHEAVTKGDLGEIALIRASVPWWRSQSYYDEPGRGTLTRDGGGVLISQAIHTLDLMLSVSAPVISVQAMTGCTKLHQMETEDFASAGLRFADGSLGSIMATTATWPGGGEEIIIDGSKGTAAYKSGVLKIDWRDGGSETTGAEGGSGGGADPMAFPCDWHRALIADFAASISQNRDSAITGREALRVHHLIDTIVTSSASGQRIDVEMGI